MLCFYDFFCKLWCPETSCKLLKRMDEQKWYFPHTSSIKSKKIYCVAYRYCGWCNPFLSMIINKYWSPVLILFYANLYFPLNLDPISDLTKHAMVSASKVSLIGLLAIDDPKSIGKAAHNALLRITMCKSKQNCFCS